MTFVPLVAPFNSVIPVSPVRFFFLTFGPI